MKKINQNLYFHIPNFFIFPLFFLFFFSLGCSSSVAEAPAPKKPSFLSKAQFFEQEGVINMTLKTDFSKLLDKVTDDDYQTATLTIENGNTAEIKVRKRGVTRRKICDFPPLKLNFKSELDASLKLVTHCQLEEDLQALVFREFLVYKMYNLLTDYSFRVQLVKMKYEDSAEEMPTQEKYGFLIENEDELSKRVNSDILETPMKLKFIDKEQSKMFTLFQYLISNTDWNLTRRHNLKIITPKADQKQPIAIPYDFDYAGLVNAPYAIPHPDLPIKNVRERHFMWRGKDRKGFEAVIQTFKDKKTEIFDLILNFPHLAEAEKKDMIEFLEASYNLMEGEVEI